MTEALQMQKVFLYFYTIIAYLFLYLLTTIIVIIGLIFNILRFKKAVRIIVGFWARASLWVIGKRLRIEGKGNISSKEKYIIMANHSSFFDIMGIMSIYPNVSWFGRSYLLDVPLFGKMLKSINYVPMQTTDLRNTKKMIERLIKITENQTVAIFPEGTRTMNGELGRFHKGFLHILRATELSILPVTLKGFYEFKPKNKFYFNYFEKLTAIIHTPIQYCDIKDLQDNEIIDLLRNIIDPQHNSKARAETFIDN